MTVGSLLLFNSDNFWTIAAALTFFGAGVIVLVGTLRRTLFLTKAKLENEVGQWQAESEYWRTIESAIVKLGETAKAVDQKADEREVLLGRLCEEAADVIGRLQELLDKAQAASRAAPKPKAKKAPAAATADDSEPDRGRIVHLDRARAAQNRNHKLVSDLFAQGKDMSEISRETGLGIGEIELILHVMRTKSGAGGTGIGTA